MSKQILFVLIFVFAQNISLLQANETWVVEQGDPRKSFWKDQVRYPYDVQYADCFDSAGTRWKIAYIDQSSSRNQKVLVLIHGKGMCAGYFGYLIRVALDQGFRVIAPDLPNYGKSIPDNLQNPIQRTLDETREAIHDLIVNRLGIQKAIYLGHSLGGQWVIGYALKYPDAVEKIILESSGGLEEFPTNLSFMHLEIPLFDPSYMKNWGRWKSIWNQYLIQEFSKTKQEIRNYYHFKQLDNDTHSLLDSDSGYFKSSTSYSRFVTDIRINMIDGNVEEYDRYIKTYIRDIYSMGIEVRKEDFNSLYKRLNLIKVPIFIAFGEKDPFIPTSLFSGHKGLIKEIIRPVFDILKEAGNVPVVKIYPETGHFIHTDLPYEFSKDVMSFCLDTKVDNAFGTLSASVEEEMEYLRLQLSELRESFERYKKDSSSLSIFNRISISADYKLKAFYRETYPNILQGQPIDDEKAFAQRIGLSLSFKDENDIRFYLKVLLNDQIWQGDRRYSNATGSTIDSGSDNIALDYAYVEIPFKPVTLRLGRQIANWGHGLVIGDDRRDRVLLLKQVGFTTLMGVYDRRQEGLPNINKDDGNMFAIGNISYTNDFTWGILLSYWDGYANYTAPEYKSAPYNDHAVTPKNGYPLENVWSFAPMLDYRFKKLNIKAAFNYMQGNGRGNGKLVLGQEYAGFWANRNYSGFIRLACEIFPYLTLETQSLLVHDGGYVDQSWDSFSSVIQNNPHNDPSRIRLSGLGGLGFDNDDQSLYALRLKGLIADILNWSFSIGKVNSRNDNPNPANMGFDNLYQLDNETFYDLNFSYNPFKRIRFEIQAGYITGDKGKGMGADQCAGSFVVRYDTEKL